MLVLFFFSLRLTLGWKKNLACTSQPCYWLPPPFERVQFSRICATDFTSARKRHSVPDLSKSAALASNTSSSKATSSTLSQNMMIRPSSSELERFYSTISTVGKPVVLSIVPCCYEAYVPLESKGILPHPISELYREEYLSLPYQWNVKRHLLVCQ